MRHIFISLLINFAGVIADDLTIVAKWTDLAACNHSKNAKIALFDSSVTL